MGGFISIMFIAVCAGLHISGLLTSPPLLCLIAVIGGYIGGYEDGQND
jgi:hypothetical protein